MTTVGQPGQLPVVASLWIDGPLRWYDALCLRSFQAQGHQVKLYVYGTVDNVPDGVDVVPAAEIYTPSDRLITATAPSFIADLFRIHLMKTTDELWADTDMLALKPVCPPPHGFVIGQTGDGRQINNSIMRLPQDSGALERLWRAITEPEFGMPWMPAEAYCHIPDDQIDERLIACFKRRRISLGPRALTWCLEDAGEWERSATQEVYSPIPWHLSDLFFCPKNSARLWITERTRALHLFSSLIRAHHRKKPPNRESLMGQFIDTFQDPDVQVLAPDGPTNAT